MKLITTIMVFALIIQISVSLTFNTNLLNCTTTSSDTYIQRIDNWSSSHRSVIKYMTYNVVQQDNVNITMLYYIVSEQSEKDEYSTFSLVSHDTVTKNRSVLATSYEENAILNSISNIVTNRNNSIQFQVVQLQDGFNESQMYESKLAIVSYSDNKIVNRQIYEDNSIEPVYHPNGTIARYETTNDTRVFNQVFTQIPIVTNVLDKYTVMLVQCWNSGLKFVKIDDNHQITSTLLIPNSLGYRDIYNTGLMNTDQSSGISYIIIPLYYSFRYAFANFHQINVSLFKFEQENQYSRIYIIMKVDINGKLLGVQQIGLSQQVTSTLKYISLSQIVIEWSVNGKQDINDMHVIGRVKKTDGAYSAMYYRLSNIDSSMFKDRRDPDVYQIYTTVSDAGLSSDIQSILLHSDSIYFAGDTNYQQVETGSVTKSPIALLFKVDKQSAEIISAQTWTTVVDRRDAAYNLIDTPDGIYFVSIYDGPITHSTNNQIKSAIHRLSCTGTKPSNKPDLDIIITSCIIASVLIMTIVVLVVTVITLYVRSKRHHQFEKLR
jgi:hypothetical protein